MDKVVWYLDVLMIMVMLCLFINKGSEREVEGLFLV